MLTTVYLQGHITYARWSRRRQGGLTGLLSGTSSLQTCVAAREHEKLAADEAILISVRAGEVAANGSETGGVPIGPKKVCGSC
jgi:hypothetical protein